MPELWLDDSPVRQELITPDADGFTLRTRYRGTQAILDQNAALRADVKRGRSPHGLAHYASIPLEVYEQEWLRLGREPTAADLIELTKRPGYEYLRTSNRRL